MNNSSSKNSIIFPGQGAQYVGMGQALYQEYPLARQMFDQADQILGNDFLEILFNGPEDKLTLTDFSQPAIYCVSCVAFAYFQELNNRLPTAVAGLSLGEYSALTAAGCLAFEEGLVLVQQRGKFMQAAAENNPGTMASIMGLAPEKIAEICAGIDGAYVANYNSPAQIVISGTKTAVEQASVACSEAGARRIFPLNVSGAFHSSLMDEARLNLLPLLESANWSEPKTTVLSNVTGQPYNCKSEIPELLAKQVVGSVRWEDNCRWMLANGIEDFFEVGPGKVLQGLMKKIERSATVKSAETPSEIKLALDL